MSKQIVVIGLGRLGQSIAKEATAIGHEVLAIDRNERLVQELKDSAAHVVRVDAMDMGALNQLGVKGFDVAIVAIGSNELASIMVTMNLVTCGVKRIIARAANDVHARILERLGVARVVFPEAETGVRVAHTFAAPQVLEYLDLTPNHGISKIPPPVGVVGKTILDARFTEHFGLNVLAVVRGHDIMVNPSGFTKIQAKDMLVVVGEDKQLEKIART